MTAIPEDVAAELALTREEGLALLSFQYRMLQRDIAAESSDRRKAKKRPVRDEFRSGLVAALARFADTGGAAELEPWAREFVEAFSAESSNRLQALEEGHRVLGAHLDRRSRALLVLINLYAFDPWDDAKWVQKTRREALLEVQGAIPSLRPEDLHSVESEYKAANRALRRKALTWKRAIADGAAGLGLAHFGGGASVDDIIKVEVITRLVLIDAEGDDEKARKVVEGLQERIRSLAEQITHAADTIRSLREEVAALKKAGEEKDNANAEKAAEIEKLRAELEDLKFTQVAFELAADRIVEAL